MRYQDVIHLLSPSRASSAASGTSKETRVYAIRKEYATRGPILPALIGPPPTTLTSPRLNRDS